MKPYTTLLLLVVTVPTFAGSKVVVRDDFKAEVQVEENGSSTSGGVRQEVVAVTVSRGFFSDPIPLDEKIAALASMTCFYRILKQGGIEPDQKVSGDYTGRMLKDVLDELLPGVPVTFTDVEDTVTILKMNVTDASLEKVVGFLDDASGVYFAYSMNGLAVSSAPPST